MDVAAVIPAFNEEKTIAQVVKTVREVPLVKEIIVVNDGSTDNTGRIAEEAGARVIDLRSNVGKGGAMAVGVRSTQAGIILFLDADLIGLQPSHVYDLINPVLQGETEMTIGVFDEGRFATDLAQFLTPYLSGQRAVKREIFETVSGLDLSRFGVEIALTRFVKSAGISFKEVELKQMSHLMKEEKLGLIKGFKARMKMYWEIAKCVGRN
ncbi:family 2 glycosyl transferase [Thermincola ferriacetica]|uniref:Glucosyl-3-phosphoglycerate synthase n=1 Tax=Thermincola ferriacetica TaxID=281456 RepID=A0A0L6W780_9FIRM|nr:glycosyltransferase family 2 protein [Thermincola ferriacetica]KNZ71243.1 family 2 glycosyl transferase [Thermincola ferriacetica]